MIFGAMNIEGTNVYQTTGKSRTGEGIKRLSRVFYKHSMDLHGHVEKGLRTKCKKSVGVSDKVIRQQSKSA